MTVTVSIPRLLAAASMALAPLGCGNTAQGTLDSAHHLWLAARPAGYETVVRKSCYCADADPYRVQVQGSLVISAVRLSPDGVETTVDPDGYQSWFTVEGLFTAVQQAIDDNVDQLDASYDAQLGHPLHIAIDPSTNASDDETTYEAARLDALP